MRRRSWWDNSLRRGRRAVAVLRSRLHNSRLANTCRRIRYSAMTAEQVFTSIHDRNTWGNPESRSGSGSTIDQTKALRTALPGLFSELAVSSILDIPCGDFNWLSRVDLQGIDYLGCDIVARLIEENSKRWGKEGVRFAHLDLLSGSLPTADLLLCRDCLVHFSFEDIAKALSNIKRSEAKYLLTTTFTQEPVNRDIATGMWRPLNLEIPPFSLPPPLTTIVEGCTEGAGRSRDKALALWRVADL